MAYNIINEQPAALIYSRSPALYQVYDVLVLSLTDFRYLAEVYVWEGAIASPPATPQFTLKRYPNAANSAHFNISQLLKEYFSSMNPTIPDQFSDSLIYNVQVDFGYVYNNAGEITAVRSAATSNIVQFVNGYTSFPKGINYTNPENTGQSNTGEFMTDQPTKIFMPESQRWTLSLYYDLATSVTQDVKIWDDNANTHTFDLSVIVTASDSSEKFVLTLDVGSDKFNDYALSPTRYWYVQGFDSSGATVTRKYTFELDCERKWGYIQMQFINKYGVWDYVPMWGRTDDTLEAKRSAFQRDTLTVGEATITYNVYSPKYLVDNIMGRVTRKMNTGFVDEDYAEVIKQLYLSPLVVDQDTLLPYTVKGTSLPIMNFNNDRLLNWTIEFEEAFEHINSVG